MPILKAVLFALLFALPAVTSSLGQGDPCSPNPCLNGGSCIHLSTPGTFRCQCNPGWTGGHCERSRIRDFQFTYPNKTVQDYVRIDMPSSASSLTAFTLSVWIRVADQSDDGTLFSYAVSDQDNELLLTDYSRFKILLGGSKVTTADLSANDDQWHHICATWENAAGSWNFYIDGQLKDSGDDFKTDLEIESGGILILGQDQDEFGGGFEQDQSFFGEMFGVNLWSFVLPEDEIKRMSEDCFYPLEGDYLKWSDLTELAEIHGNVRIESPSKCSP